MCKAIKLKNKEELLSIAEEIAFAKALAANDKNLRDRALKKLRKWLLIKSNQDSSGIRFTEEGFMRLWRGLFYCVWMSDKPLVQEECVEYISNLVHCLSDIEVARKFIRCFYQCISQTWFGLDGHRIDKYLMLVRRFLRQTLQYLANTAWDEEKVVPVCNDFFKSLQMAPLGLNLHLAEIYLEEVAKVGRGELKPSTILQLLKPFADILSLATDTRLVHHVNDFIFLQLLRQSDEGIKFGAKFEIWKELGFPEGDIDVIQEASEDEVEDLEAGSEQETDDDENEINDTGAMDPRAGNVDVVLPPLDFDAREINNYLQSLARKKDTTTKGRKAISFLTKKYDKFIEGHYPLGIHKVEIPDKTENVEDLIESKAMELIDEEKNYSLEKEFFKKGRPIVPSDAWEVTPCRHNDLITNASNKPCSNKGQWEIEKLKKRKKSQVITDVNSIRKKIKVSNAGSFLVETRTDSDEMEIKNIEIPLPMEDVLVGSQNKKVSKPKKKSSSKHLAAKILSKGKYNAVLKHIHKMMAKQHNEKLKKIEEADKEWGVTHRRHTQEENASEQNELNDSSGGKRVEFVLSKNMSQEINEYEEALKQSPNLPLQLDRMPRHGVLKPSPLPSPINPFYTPSVEYDEF